MNIIHFYRPSFVIVKTNVFRSLKFIEKSTSACEHNKVKTIDSTNLSIGGRELDMINENFKGLSNVPDERNEFSSIEDLLVATEKSWLAEGIFYYNNESAVSGQIFPFLDDESFCLNNTILFLSYDCGLFYQCLSILMIRIIAFLTNQLIDNSHQQTNFFLKIGFLRAANATNLMTIKIKI